MSNIKFGNKYVDDKFATIVEPNLFGDSVLIPGVTFTAKYQEGSAGQIFVHKPGVATITPTLPGGDFSHADQADDLIAIKFNNEFKRSRKIKGVQAAAVAYNLAEAELSTAIQEVSEAIQTAGLCALTEESSTLQAGGSDDTTAITKDNVKDYILKLRKAVRNGKGNVNFAIFSTEVFEKFLQYVGSDYTPVFNDEVQRTNGRVIQALGLTIIEANLLNNETAKYINQNDVVTTVDLTEVDMIVGDYDANSLLVLLEALRVVDTPDFIGSLAQVLTVTGYKVTNSARIVKKVNNQGY